VADADTWLPVSAVVIDEAQDLSPAQWMVAEKLFAGAEQSACFADDDQAIFSFQGAEPDLFNSRSAKRQVLLEQSWRLPRAVCEVALRVINQNRNRVPKIIRPLDTEGEARRVSHLNELDFANGESWLILIRNWRFLAEIVSWLEAQGLPYRVPSAQHYCPWDEKGPFNAARSVLDLAEGREISLTDLAVLVGKTRVETEKAAGAWRYGSKKRLTDLATAEPYGRVGLRELLTLGLTDTGLARILNNDLSLLEGVSVRDRDAYGNALREGRFGQEPRIRVSSIHGMKGDEAENVVVLEACSNAPYRNLQDQDRREEEIRLQYVAVTRAKKRVYALQGWAGQPWIIEGWR
jgi:superfamily I DNA/RNA helicase